MYKHLFRTALGLMGLVGILAIGVVNADNEFIVHDTENGTITVYSQDYSYGITIQDKNLGATTPGTGAESYGYYFQWGNNHGNYAGTNTGTLNELLEANVNDWVNKGYSGDNDKFIIFNNGNKSTYDYRSGVYYTNATDNSYVGESPYNNLWGGGDDNDDSNPKIVKGYDTEKHTATNTGGRQGPCGEGYHVPSAGEWKELMMLWCNANSDICSGGVINTQNGEYARENYLSSNEIGTAFSNDLSLPLAGRRNYDDGTVYDRGNPAYYWSSSPRGGSYPMYAWYLLFYPDSVIPGYYVSRAYGGSIRCFKNEYVKPSINKDIVIEATSTAADQTLKINKYFANAYTVDWGDGTTGNLTADTQHTYSTAGTYTIILSLSGADRWTFQNVSKPLVPINGATMTGVKITSMPSLEEGFGASATSPGNYFFRAFNYQGAITSLPTGSFDTSKITTAGDYFFSNFNYYGQLTSLPTGSFDTSKITTARNYFFYCFNAWGQLTSLPTGSFDTSKITTAVTTFFYCFNAWGQLTSLPTGSFDTSKITTAGNYFFASFNNYGQLTSLPAGSFDTSKITTAGTNVFYEFNNFGQLTSLPTGSFDTSKITTAGNYFFADFNHYGKITTLPESFKLTSAAYDKTDGYQNSFNSPNYTLNRKVSDLVSGITVPSSNRATFSDNQPGRCGVHANWLVSTANACNVKYDANGGVGTITGGYMSNATGVAPGSGIDSPTREGFILSGWLDASGNIVDEIVFPDMDGQTLYAQWTPIDYTITFVDGSGENVDVVYTGDYNSAVETQYPEWTKDGYTISWDKEIPDTMPLSGDTITASWISNEYTITFVDGSGTETDVIYTGAYESVVETQYPEWTKEGYTIHWDKGIPTTMPLSGETITASWEINQYTITIDVDGNITTITGDYGSPITPPSDPSKNGYKFIGWEPEIPATMPAEDMTIKAKWEKNGSSGGGGGSNKSSSDVISNDSEKSTEQKDGDTGMDSSAEPQNDNQNAQDSQQAEQASDKVYTASSASEGQTYTQEFQEAYEFAKGKGITTMPTIQKADMDGKLTRIAMAKMLSQYAINVLGMAPDITQNNKFNDVTEKMDSDYDDGVTLAYQLGIMGQNMPNNKFRPNDEVTRGEFVTALSRMLYNTSDGEYRSTPKYYTHHMEKMEGEGIITNTDPNMKELRGYVMIMLMRSVK